MKLIVQTLFATLLVSCSTIMSTAVFAEASSKISCVTDKAVNNALSLFGVRKKKESYSPLLYFTVPKNEFESCNKMDKIVSEVERELSKSGQKIVRLNVRKNPLHLKLNQMLGGNGCVPFLYHRESCQKIKGVASKDKVMDWARGRWVESTLSLEENLMDEKNNQNEPPLEAIQDQQEAEEEKEIEENGNAIQLTELKGKKALREK